MEERARGSRFTGFLILLITCALLLIARLAYLYLIDPIHFPIGTIKIAASYQHLTRKELEDVLAQYNQESFISLPMGKLQRDLQALTWVDTVTAERQWPDTLKITLIEKKPAAVWNDALMTEDGRIFQVNSAELKAQLNDETLPRLSGPNEQQRDVLQSYQKLSKLLSSYGLHAASLALRENQAWELSLTDGLLLRLGKTDVENRVLRFCRAYTSVFADKAEQLVSVDLRYTHGMAVQWKESTNK